MAGRILLGDPDPFVDGDDPRRVLEVRGRRSRDLVQVPIAVVSRGAERYPADPAPGR